MGQVSSVPGRSAAKEGGLVALVNSYLPQPTAAVLSLVQHRHDPFVDRNLCYESNKDGLQIGGEITRCGHKPAKAHIH